MRLAEYFVKETDEEIRNENAVQKIRWVPSKNLKQPNVKKVTIYARKWKNNPAPKKGYQIVKVESGYTADGFPYQFYRMYKVNERNVMANHAVKSTEEEKRMYCETGKRQAEEKNMKTYMEFLKDKVIKAPISGIEVSPTDISHALKPHQRDAVLWALKGGRRALFEAFGLGKSIQQLEWCRVLIEKIGGKALIVCPLGVKQEFAEDAVHLLNIPAPTYVRNMEEVKAADNRILITNYERIRDGDIDPHYFTACSLDEASVLRSFGSKTYQTFLPKFKGVKYKLVATATPAPNKYKELIHYGGYLEIMDTGQALTRFFQRDSTKANNLTLYPHKEKEFWLWLSTWHCLFKSPLIWGIATKDITFRRCK